MTEQPPQSKQTRVIGIDIGMRNFSWCDLSVHIGQFVYHPLFPTTKLPRITLHCWKLLDLKATLAEEATRNLHSYFVQSDQWRQSLDAAERVVIEKQPDALMLHGQKMLQFSMAVLMAMLDRNKIVLFESPKRRLNVFADIIPLLPIQSKSKSSHERNKIISKQLCELVLRANGINPGDTDYGDAVKRDDYADSFMLALLSAWLGTMHAEAIEDDGDGGIEKADKWLKDKAGDDTKKTKRRQRKNDPFEIKPTISTATDTVASEFVVTDIKKLGDEKVKRKRKVTKRLLIGKGDFAGPPHKRHKPTSKTVFTPFIEE